MSVRKLPPLPTASSGSSWSARWFDAGRRLFAASRSRKAAPNDADRLRKYLARFGLDWKALREEAAVSPPPR